MADVKKNIKAEDKERAEFLGLDIGNFDTKTSKNYKIRSRIAMGYDNLSDDNEKISKVEVDGKKYTVGKGADLIFDEKYFEKNYKIMLLNAIGSSFDESIINVHICIGMPVNLSRNKNLRLRVQEYLQNIGTNTIIINGIKKTIKILSAYVWIEGGILYYSKDEYKNENFITVDIGGYTVDLVANKQGKVDSAEAINDSGVIKLLNDICKIVNEEYNAELSDGLSILESFLKKEEYLINGERPIDMSLVDEMIDTFCQDIFSKVNQRFPLNEYKLKFIGGGSAILVKNLEKFKNKYSIEVLGKAEFINSYTYENVIRLRN